MRKEKYLTTEAFVLLLSEYFRTDPSRRAKEDLWLYGRQRGWLEEQDQLFAQRNVEKRYAARIVHEFLRIELKEADERAWRFSKAPEDLYHCRVCANHIAQVLVKGIIPCRDQRRFGILDPISDKEAMEIFERMKKKEKRIRNEKGSENHFY